MATIRETYPARVTKNEDPDKRGRVKVVCAGLMGDDETELPGWIEPALDWGWFFVPDIGELIEICCVAENDQQENASYQAFLENPELKWTGVRYQSLEGGTPRPPNPLMTDKNYGKRRGFATPLGHVLIFDDTKGDESIIISWHRGNEGEYTQITMDKLGSIMLLDYKSNMIHLNAKDDKEGITILDKNANLIALDKDGVKVVDKFSNIIEMKDGLIQVMSQKDLLIKSGANTDITVEGNASVNVTGTTDIVSTGDAKIEAPKVDIKTPNALIGDGADSPFVRHTEWNAWASAHTHPTAFGPSGPPIAPPPPAIASTLAKVK